MAGPKLGDSARRFLEAKRPQYSDSTMDCYKTDLRQLWRFLGEDKDVTQITLQDILDWREHYQFTERSWHRKVKPVRALYWWMMENGEIEDSPVENYMPPVPDNRATEPFSAQELFQLRTFRPEKYRQHRARVLIFLMVEGLWFDEARLLTLPDINFDLGVIFVGKRVVPMSAQITDVLEKWLEVRRQRGDQQALITSYLGKRMWGRVQHLNEMQELCQFVLGKYCTRHTYRATFLAKLAREYGHDIDRLAELAGRDQRRMYAVADAWAEYDD